VKKQKHPASAGATGVETFGGDYHKCESTFEPRSLPAVDVGEPKRKAHLRSKGKRKKPHDA